MSDNAESESKVYILVNTDTMKYGVRNMGLYVWEWTSDINLATRWDKPMFKRSFQKLAENWMVLELRTTETSQKMKAVRWSRNISADNLKHVCTLVKYDAKIMRKRASAS